MSNKAFSIVVLFFIAIAFSSCHHPHVKVDQLAAIKPSGHIDTFELKYKIKVFGRSKSIDDHIYVGTKISTIKINGEEYKSLVFGDSINVIGFVKQDNDKITYFLLGTPDTAQEKIQDTIGPNVLLYFDKPINYKWKVDLDNSYLWKRVITFAGTEPSGLDTTYVYNVTADETAYDIGDHISKIYFSKQQGFLKFDMKTHWITVEVNKLKSH